MNDTASILIVDDDRLVRKSLATRLRRCPDLDARFAAAASLTEAPPTTTTVTGVDDNMQSPNWAGQN